MELVYVVLIGIAAGWIAGQMTKGRGFGLVGNLVIGVLGAVIGGMIVPLLGFKATSLLGQLIQATVGALLLLFLLGLASGKKRRRRT
ncbi:MAG TPA: GlsB/YeaQ/YmgE family stress response membrane protein [Planctomycetota bacterium]|nr:GlsB/YeaQ/YmgE family stress response membrane protein [Planctomycetota bacterium]